MNQILNWLSGGDLRSDGMADEAATFVLENPQVFDDLFAGLRAPDDVVRGRAADALEKIAREQPDLLIGHLTHLKEIAETDPVPMVKMHLAMLFGHLIACNQDIAEIKSILLHLLQDDRVFTRSWAIVSLCILAREFPLERNNIVEHIAPLQADNSVAIRTRAQKALNLLTNENAPFPKGWIKSQHFSDL